MTRFNVISSDDHFIEPGDLWLRYISPMFKDRAPRLKHEADTDVYWIEGVKPLPIGQVGAAGKSISDIRPKGRFEEDVPRGAYEHKARLEDMARDGVDA